MKHKMVFLDIDGTLTTFQGVLPDSAARALREANANGHHLFICTGRSATQLYPALLEKGLFTGYITSAGADIRMGNLVLLQHSILSELLIHVLDVLDSFHASYFLQCPDGVFTDPATMDVAPDLIRGNRVTAEQARKLFGKITCRTHLREVKNCQKLCFYRAHGTLETIQEKLGDTFDTLRSSFGESDTCDGEIMVRGYNKGAAIDRVLKATGTDRQDTIAFGDGPNDWEMLKFVQTGVAMGNASEELKEKADLVTDSIDKDGLYKGFQMAGLL